MIYRELKKILSTSKNVTKISQLTEEEENILEKKMVWIFAPPRSGTTWFGSQLLNHSSNIIWFEPWIGFHLAAMAEQKISENKEPQFERIIDANAKSDSYFFSSLHRINWLPALRKFILTRTYSEAQTLSKNIIIKEPVGAQASDILMECFPSSKLIFLLRDGRDVVDSRIDMHRKSSWANLRPLDTPQIRMRMIRWYSYQWKKIIERINKAYKNHSKDLRILVRYEDLRKNTENELQKIYKFLDIKIELDEIKKIVEKFSYENITNEQKGNGKFIRLASPGKWKENFSSEEIKLMEDVMESTLKKLGY